MLTVAQNIVIGSQYPVCVALRIAKWFNDRAEYDVARGIYLIYQQYEFTNTLNSQNRCNMDRESRKLH